MTVEIKELIIKTEVTSDETQGDKSLSAVEVAEIKRQVVAQCLKKLLRIIKQQADAR